MYLIFTGPQFLYLFPIRKSYMGILDTLFYFFSILSVVHGQKQNVCPTTFCGGFSLDYPFKLPDKLPQNNCTYTNLFCNANLNYGTPVVTLPYGGDFYVRYIDYLDSYIELYDPEGCLMKRLMNKLNLSSSPFKVIAYENYTFYTCPSSPNNVTPLDTVLISCLSNSTSITVATSFPSSDLLSGYKCEVFGSWQLPVLGLGQFDLHGGGDDLYLTWNQAVCKSCEDTQQNTDDSNNFLGAYVGSPIFMPSAVLMGLVFTICLLFMFKRRGSRDEINVPDIQPETATATTAPPHQEGLDDSKINTCTSLVIINESKTNSEPDSSSYICPICLEGYKSQDIVRSIAKCEHRFHADCIELWLRKNITCPVCRTTLSDVEG
ncbi:putative RING-H2 finger protein ATL21A [Primulina huaijiensis]|uniref:putative RING-H2 finger protein ATL21A n=1 Tax=Primulina huaijiensis TaxID=1492673 RepID=UPI003CC73158